MEFRAKQIAPPKNWERFEELCHSLFKSVWNDPLAQRNGRRGQAQHGVDVFGSPTGDRAEYEGVQCKGKEANYGAAATVDELLAEVRKAELFSPKLKHWIFATTAPVDGSLQKAARELSVERAKGGLFTVSVLGWEEIQAQMKSVQVGDTLVVWKLDRLARSLRQLIDTMDLLERRGSGFRSLTEAIDTNTPGGRLIFHIMAALAEFERSVIRERTLAGLAVARAEGRIGGRRGKLTEAQLARARQAFVQGRASVAQLAEGLGVSPSTLYRRL